MKNEFIEFLARFFKFIESCLVPEEVIADLNEAYQNKYPYKRYIEAAAITWNARWSNCYIWANSLFVANNKCANPRADHPNRYHKNKNSRVHFIAKFNTETYFNNWALFIIFTMITLVITIISLTMLAIIIQSNKHNLYGVKEIFFNLFLPTDILKDYFHNSNYKIINLPDFLKSQLLLLCSIICFFNSVLEYSSIRLDKQSVDSNQQNKQSVYPYYWLLFGISFYVIHINAQYSFGECISNWIISHHFFEQKNKFLLEIISSLILPSLNLLILKSLYNQIHTEELLINSDSYSEKKVRLGFICGSSLIVSSLVLQLLGSISIATINHQIFMSVILILQRMLELLAFSTVLATCIYYSKIRLLDTNTCII